MSESIYNDGEYLANNPTWHMEDSPWKASNIVRLMRKNELDIKSICEIGCGAGEILNQLWNKLDNSIQYHGYEISGDAYVMCKVREKERLQYVNADLLAENNKDFYDLLLVIDIFEHIEDYFSFLRKCKNKSTYKIFHIPLDISVQTVLRNSPFLVNRQKVGHIHYFTKDLALEALKDTGYEIIDYFYTGTATELAAKSIKGKLAKWPRKILFSINPDLTVRVLGGYSLMVLAK
ncbi:methyltransferase domain-containing protein [Chitinophaga sp. XS-30]|uniref:methyltransferase domain-containing protein n=1 Tax=Chitinophaga sp. XS-30 TaxID=2604421 RepID=UPI0011DDA935|nr:methyltransferase domain-containing protein [Chitinophaga sp. XS-30]QEH39763.1 class I SAM-dependent methyltransferase [Chitinophaga sp. XS-30]